LAVERGRRNAFRSGEHGRRPRFEIARPVHGPAIPGSAARLRRGFAGDAHARRARRTRGRDCFGKVLRRAVRMMCAPRGAEREAVAPRREYEKRSRLEQIATARRAYSRFAPPVGRPRPASNAVDESVGIAPRVRPSRRLMPAPFVTFDLQKPCTGGSPASVGGHGAESARILRRTASHQVLHVAEIFAAPFDKAQS